MSKLFTGIIIIACFIFPLVTEARDRVDSSNKFGGGSSMDSESHQFLKYTGVGWVRPHYGPAIWDMIQSKKNSKYDWDDMDTMVKWYQKRGYNILVTIWPFATWDQQNRKNAADCLLADSPSASLTGELPAYACNPNNWKKYRKWVKAMVERYDGDGKKDMPKLKYGITHWEVMNEPDLTDQIGVSKEDGDQTDGDDKEDGDQSGDDSPDFYAQGADAYYKLLKKTATAIRASDKNAKVVIAGAAGMNSVYVDYWNEFFTDHPKAKKYFDIGNVHCISEEEYVGNYNVKAYARILRQHGMTKKNIWVTEADAMIYDTKEENYAQTRRATKKALNAGAAKLFNVTSSFGGETKDITYAKKKFKKIIDKFN